MEGASGELQLSRKFAWEGGRITSYSGAALKATNQGDVELLLYATDEGVQTRERYLITVDDLMRLIRENGSPPT
jgi:hypothetical protein